MSFLATPSNVFMCSKTLITAMPSGYNMTAGSFVFIRACNYEPAEPYSTMNTIQSDFVLIVINGGSELQVCLQDEKQVTFEKPVV